MPETVSGLQLHGQQKKDTHFFYGDADPDNTLKEPKIKQYNNLPQGTDVKVK